MSLVTRHLSRHGATLNLDVAAFGKALCEACPEAVFALLMGSSRAGQVEVGADVDLAFYTAGEPTLEFLGRVQDISTEFAPGAHCDIGLLNTADIVFRFEALKGRLLFCRDRQGYAEFFSHTCREYESQVYDYERQLQYRVGSR